MGYGLMVSLVPLADLRRAFGSGDETLVVAARGARCPDEVLLAIGRIVDGSATKTSPDARALASAYGYATQRLCDVVGETLTNEGLYPTSLDALRELDGLLKAHGVRLSIEGLVLDGPVLDLPMPDDYPMSGVIGGATLAEATLRAEDAPEGPHALAWKSVASWLERARAARAEHPDGDWALVGFWY